MPTTLFDDMKQLKEDMLALERRVEALEGCTFSSGGKVYSYEKCYGSGVSGFKMKVNVVKDERENNDPH
jgi:hypothetical protein